MTDISKATPMPSGMKVSSGGAHGIRIQNHDDVIARLKAENADLREALRIAEAFISGAVPRYARDQYAAVNDVLPTIRTALARLEKPHEA